jgi:hypothetical protein
MWPASDLSWTRRFTERCGGGLAGLQTDLKAMLKTGLEFADGHADLRFGARERKWPR